VTAEIDTLKRFCFGANVTFEPAWPEADVMIFKK
jgi:hypothetical protein